MEYPHLLGSFQRGLRTPGDHGGLLALISHRLCQSQEISSTSPIQGRIQHVQRRIAQVTVDLVQVYQYTTEVTATRSQPLDSRASVWTHLDTTLTNLPECGSHSWGLQYGTASSCPGAAGCMTAWRTVPVHRATARWYPHLRGTRWQLDDRPCPHEKMSARCTGS